MRLPNGVLINGILLLVTPMLVQASISLDQSRIIFTSSQKMQTVTIQNDSAKTYLIQTQVQDSGIDGPKSEYFLVVPPLFRLEASGQHVMQLLPQHVQSLPRDRESVFYFSATALPAMKKPAGSAENTARLSIATRLVIKLFYRPATLPITDEQAAGQLQFTSMPQGGLCFINPTPYFITISQAWAEGHAIPDTTGLMLAPKSAHAVKNAVLRQPIRWQVINDFGGVSQHYQYSRVSGAKACQFVD